MALLTGLFSDDVWAVAVRRGLVGFASALSGPACYIPHDVAAPGLLQVGDVADIAAALAPRPLWMTELVDGRNRAVSEPAMRGWNRLSRPMPAGRINCSSARNRRRRSQTGSPPPSPGEGTARPRRRGRRDILANCDVGELSRLSRRTPLPARRRSGSIPTSAWDVRCRCGGLSSAPPPRSPASSRRRRADPRARLRGPRYPRP